MHRAVSADGFREFPVVGLPRLEQRGRQVEVPCAFLPGRRPRPRFPANGSLRGCGALTQDGRSVHADLVAHLLDGAGQVAVTETGILPPNPDPLRGGVDLDVLDALHGLELFQYDIHAGFAVPVLYAELDILHDSHLR